jgi:thiol-disulfide isomerase/thioredoxin
MPPLPPDMPPPVLEVFYSPSCAPCRLELPAVAEVARSGNVVVRVVILDQDERARSELRAVSPALAAAAAAPGAAPPGDVLLGAGNRRGILPYARSLTSEGTMCASWSGGLTVSRARSLLAACTRLISPSRSPS